MHFDPIIEPSDLSELGSYLLLDVRNREAFTGGHAYRAIRVPIELWEGAAKSSVTSFENLAFWEREIAKLGIDNAVHVVVYDDGRLTEAARVWFILQYFGANAFILNGGWPHLEGKSLPGALFRQSAVTFTAAPGRGRVGLVDRHALKASLGLGTSILDARTADEFSGQDLRRNARGGHLPHARPLSHSKFLNGSLIKPAEELRLLLEEAGFREGDHVVTHCDGGGRAALAAAAAARAGYFDVRAYYLSFSDWAKDESCPVVSPPTGQQK